MKARVLAALFAFASPLLAQFPAPSRPVASIVSPSWSDEASRDAAAARFARESIARASSMSP